MAAAELPQHVRQHLLASCLADRAGDRHQPAAGITVRRARPRRGRQRRFDIPDRQKPAGGVGDRLRDKRRDGAVAGGSGDEAVPVGMLPRKGGEQAPGAAAAAVDLDPGDGEVGRGAGPAAAGAAGQFGGAKRHLRQHGSHAVSPSPVRRLMALRATLESLNGSVSSPTSWKLSCPCRRSEAHRRHRGRPSRPMAARRGRHFDGVRAGLEDVASDRRRILGTRIVVGDPDQVGMFMRHPPHQGAFAGVALAAGAEDKGKASAPRDEAPSAPIQARPACGRNRR